MPNNTHSGNLAQVNYFFTPGFQKPAFVDASVEIGFAVSMSSETSYDVDYKMVDLRTTIRIGVLVATCTRRPKIPGITSEDSV